MLEAGIHSGGRVVVERDVPARPGDGVIAVIDNEFTLKTLAESRCSAPKADPEQLRQGVADAQRPSVSRQQCATRRKVNSIARARLHPNGQDRAGAGTP
jgi:hypothetical protein